MILYRSTRGQSGDVTASQAIINGIALDGGLLVPASIPVLTEDEWKFLREADYRQTAVLILSKYLGDFTLDQIRRCVQEAYRTDNFATDEVVRIVEIERGISVLELWHGPTAAFKDIALQLLPRLLKTALCIRQDDRRALILTATSGDTGKAALEGFCDVSKTTIGVLYPNKGVSAVQQLQMVTQQGDNVAVSGVSANFDRVQTAVKNIFKDASLAERLRAKNTFLTSANSINWGRLLPQIVYYIYACAQMRKQRADECARGVDVCVPTGNFGNILAAYYAKQMGAPIDRLFCASNANNVLFEFVKTGQYNSQRPFYKTMSPSMDILVSSNLERLLWILSRDESKVALWMHALLKNGEYRVDSRLKDQIQQQFDAFWCDDRETSEEIYQMWEKGRYLSDPHTAVALYAARRLRREKPVLVVSTASPLKFPADVLRALRQKSPEDELEAAADLSIQTGLAIPRGISELKTLKKRFNTVISPEKIGDWVTEILV